MVQSRLFTLFAFLLLSLCSFQTVFGQQYDWARKMFGEKTSHDFGIVAAASDAVYKFELTNLYKEDIHIASVTSSCNCTIPSIEKNTLKTYEKGYVVARFNTRAFRDKKQAVLTVRIDRPYYAEVQLIVKGNIRGNVAFEPGSVKFGNVPQGSESAKRIQVIHRGGPNWRIKDIKTTFDSNQISVGLSQPVYRNGTLVYDMDVKLKGNVPAGFLSGQLQIETNEGGSFTYPLAFNGRVVPPVELSPSILAMGPLAPGQVIEKRLFLKADAPFRIKAITSSDACLQLVASDQPSKIQEMKVTYRAGDKLGRHACEARITTDANAKPTVFKAFAIVEKK